MLMEVSFRTKEESNREQEKAFLRLSPIERIHSYIDFMLYTQDFPGQAISRKSENFQVEIISKKK